MQYNVDLTPKQTKKRYEHFDLIQPVYKQSSLNCEYNEKGINNSTGYIIFYLLLLLYYVYLLEEAEVVILKNIRIKEDMIQSMSCQYLCFKKRAVILVFLE